MNERIRELAEQAGLLHKQIGPTLETRHMKKKEQDLEKFAELIVGECIEKITTYDLVPGHSAKWEDIYNIHTRLLQDLGEELKEHFGVK